MTASVRGRLTVALLILTGLITALGVWLSMTVLDDRVREQAIDERAALAADSVGTEALAGVEAFGFLEDVDDFDDLDDDEFIAITSQLGSALDVPELIEFMTLESPEESALFLFDQNVEELAFATAQLAAVGTLDEVTDAFGQDDDALVVWLDAGYTAQVTRDSRTRVPSVLVQPLSERDEADEYEADEYGAGNTDSEGGTPVAAADLIDLQFGRSGAASADGELAFGVRAVAGEQVGFVADVSDEISALSEVRQILWLAAVGLTLLAGLATWFIVGRALRPVGAMTRRVGEISSANLNERVPVSGQRDEIAELGTTMNSMLDRIESGDLRRRQFVSDASHELRTPVAVLRSEAEVALKASDRTTVPELAQVVLNESNRMGAVVEDLLTLARADEGPGRGAPAAQLLVDLDEIVLREAQRSRPVAVDCRGVSAGRVLGREDELTRVVTHLLDNAARHATSTVAVTVQTLGDRVQLTVDDDGRGVAAADRERIFDRFVRLDEARTRDQGGAGLGLAVVRTSVAAVGGEVRAEASPLGGARFVVDLPAAGASDAA